MPRGKKIIETVVTPVRQVCEWCNAEVLAGQNPPQLVTCPKCQKIENTWLAETPCPSCGGRKARSVTGVVLKNGHRDSCITYAQPVQARRPLTQEDVDEIRARLGPAPVAL